MKKFYYLVFMLVMVISGVTFVSCGGDEEEEIIDEVGGNGRTFLFSFDGSKEFAQGNEYMELEDYLNPIYYVGWPGEDNHFSIDRYPINGAQLHFDFSDKEASFFKVGYSDFTKDATRIVYITAAGSGWEGEYESGKAKVTSNNGEFITIQFSNFKCEIERNDIEHTILLDGTLKFRVYRY